MHAHTYILLSELGRVTEVKRKQDAKDKSSTEVKPGRERVRVGVGVSVYVCEWMCVCACVCEP